MATITLESKNFSLNLPASGFFRLRGKLADLYGGQVAKHYRRMDDAVLALNEQERDDFLTSYGEETATIEGSLNSKGRKLWDFLYAPDEGGSVSYGTCKVLLDVTGTYRDDQVYGYKEPKIPVTFDDFVRVVRDCAAHKTKLKWHCTQGKAARHV